TRSSCVLPLPEPPTSVMTSSRRTFRFRFLCRICPGPTALTRPSISITCSFGSADIAQEDRENRVEDDHAGDRGDHRAGNATGETVGIRQHAQAEVTRNERDRETERRRLPDADPEVDDLDRARQRF